MRFLFPILCCAALFAGCDRDAAPDAASTKKPVAPAQAADYDEHSYAEPTRSRSPISHSISPSTRCEDTGRTATYTLGWKAPAANRLILDTRDLSIEKSKRERQRQCSR